MTTIELIYKKDFISVDGSKINYNYFTSGDEFSILFNKKGDKKLFVYDSINNNPEEYNLNDFDFIVINHYIHYPIDEMVNIYKEYVDSTRIINSSKKFTFSYNEKMGFEKLKDCLTDNWRKLVLEKLIGDIKEFEMDMQDDSSEDIAINRVNNSYENNAVKEEDD